MSSAAPRSRRRLGAALPVLASLLCAACPGDAEPDARSLVLITLDTTRRDALGAFGGPPGVTPNLDAFAAECELYLGARTVAPLTLPAHASMLTGLYPPRHTVRDNSLTPVPRTAVTLAEKARDAGLATGAVVAAAVLASPYGLDQGFATYDEPERASGDHSYGAREASEVTALARAWLDGVPAGERYFLWAHYFDPHRPLDAGPELRARVGGDPYLACVARMDDGVGEFLDALRARADWEDTLVMVVSDHGEANGEHGEGTHSVFVYDGTIRVPMMVRFPGRLPRAPGGIDAAVSVADVFPTAVDLLGLGSPGDVDGRSLRAPPDPERGVYFESYYGRIYYGWSPLVGWAAGSTKYVHSSAPEMYDVGADPGETRNLAGERDARDFLAELEALSRRRTLEPAGETIDRAMLAELEKMGYAGAGGAGELPGPLDLDPDRPNPHTRPAELAAIVQSWGGDEERRAQSIELLRGVVARDPRNHGSWARLGRLLLERGEHAEAAAALERFVALDVPWPEERFRLAECYVALDRGEDAAAALELGLELDPDNVLALQKLVELYQALDRNADAARAFERLEAARR